jgi:hypothetical protein
MGGTLEWLSAHDPTKLFAGRSRRAGQVFGVSTRQVPVDPTPFVVRGNAPQEKKDMSEGEGTGEVGSTDPAVMAIPSGYARDHREDLTQGMLALATTHEGDCPLFSSPFLATNVSVLAAIPSIQKQLPESDDIPSVSVVEQGVYGEARRLVVSAARRLKSGAFERPRATDVLSKICVTIINLSSNPHRGSQ